MRTAPIALHVAMIALTTVASIDRGVSKAGRALRRVSRWDAREGVVALPACSR